MASSRELHQVIPAAAELSEQSLGGQDGSIHRYPRSKYAHLPREPPPTSIHQPRTQWYSS